MANNDSIVVINNVQNALIKEVNGAINGGLSLPEGYDAEKALVTAFNMIKQDPKLMGCTPESIGQSLRNMVYMGLDITAKQAYPIPYGNKLTIDPSYFGIVAMVKRIHGVIDVVAREIYEDDDFEYDYDAYGIPVITTHKSKLQNRNGAIVGAYATIILDPEVFGRDKHVEIMTIEEIHKAWGQGATKGKSPAHTNFPQEMAKKSVLARGCKMFIRTLTDSKYMDMVGAFTQEDDKRMEAEYTENVREEALKVTATPVEEIVDVKAEEYSAMMDNLEIESEF